MLAPLDSHSKYSTKRDTLTLVQGFRQPMVLATNSPNKTDLSYALHHEV